MPRKATNRPIPYSRRRRARHERPHARQRRDRRRRGIRYRRGRRQHESARPDGAGHSPRARGLRAGAEATSTASSAPPRRRAHRRCRCASICACPRPIPIPPSSAARRSRFMSRTRRRRLAAGLCSVAVIAYGSTQRTVGRRQASAREYNPYETPFRPFLPSTRLRAGRLAPHARVRHDARTAGRGGGGGARMGAAEPGRMGEEAADHRETCCRRDRSAIRSPCATAA